jgi:hypothetical protein
VPLLFWRAAAVAAMLVVGVDPARSETVSLRSSPDQFVSA